jgi:hypothetical protein
LSTETYACCELGPLDQVRVRYKRSNAAKELDGKLAVVMRHVVTTEDDDFSGEHLLELLGGEVIWGNEAEKVAPEAGRRAVTFEQALAEVNVLLQLPYPQRDKLRREILRLAAESPLPVEDFMRGLPPERLKEIGESLD